MVPIALLLFIAGMSGLLLGVVVMRRMGAQPEARSFRATDRRGGLARVGEELAPVLPWLLGAICAGSLLWLVAIVLGIAGA